ncbi:MAG: hypothetical protein AAFX56_01010 [Pseudomonadota bacterium]
MQQILTAIGFLALALAAESAFAVVTEDSINEAYYRGDADTLEELRTELSNDNANDTLLAGYLDWRLASLYIGMGDEASAEASLERGQLTLETLLEDAPKKAEAWAMLSSTLGMRIGMRPVTLGFVHGRTASKAMSTALEIEPVNPRVLLLDAIGKLNTPSMFGGSREEALKQLDAALAAFQANGPGRYKWGEADTYVWRGIARQRSDQPEAALADFNKALELEPAFNWARSLRDSAESR